MDKVKLTYLGQTGFLIEYQGTRIVTDPYLSDYVDKTESSEAFKWRRKYAPPSTLADINPDAVVISHAHGDHLDPWTIQPFIESGKTAAFILPAPESAQLTAWGATSVIGAVAGETLRIGKVEIMPIACAHTEFHMDDAGRYRELSYFIRAGRLTLFFAGDASLYDGLTERIAEEKCNALLLPVNGGDYYRTRMNIIGNMNCIEAAKLTKRSGAEFFIPMHHDLYGGNGCRIQWVIDAAKDECADVRPLSPGESMILEAE